jgi:glyoxylase I family protein
MPDTASATTTATVPALRYLGAIHEGIPVKNLEASVKFYTEVLGLKLLPRPNLPGPGAWLGDEDNTVQFHLIVTQKDYIPGPEAKMSPTGRHTAWMVRSLDDFRARMERLGVPYHTLKGVIASDQLFVVDPEGHTWEFQEPK